MSLSPNNVIPYGKQTIDQDDIDAVVEVLKSDWLTQGPKVVEFEKALASYSGAAYAVVFNNGTSALQAAYFAAGLEVGDEIVSTPLTFSATTNAALWFQAVPKFADVLSNGQINPQGVEKLLTAKTRVIAPVDFAGHPAELKQLNDLAHKKDIIVIEDACHALGATFQGQPVGSLSDMTIFSFHPVKSITTGEGGAVVTQRKEFYDRLCRFRNHGFIREGFTRPSPGAWYHEMQDLGLNLRLTDIQSALGVTQLKKLPSFLHKRREIADRYQKAFQSIKSVRMLLPNSGDESAWHLFVLVLEGDMGKKRDDIFNELRTAGIGVQLHYIPVYRHPYYERLGYATGLCPAAEDLSSRCLSLPIYPTLSEADQNQVIEKVKSILSEAELSIV